MNNKYKTYIRVIYSLNMESKSQTNITSSDSTTVYQTVEPDTTLGTQRMIRTSSSSNTSIPEMFKLSPKAAPFIPNKPFDYSNTDLVIYHGKCPDGTAGAWAFWKYLTKVQGPQVISSKFHPGKFGETPPDVTDKNVVFVDFTYPVEMITNMLVTAKSIRVLDHHKTALPLKTINNPKFSFVLDMERSGVQIAWDELNPTEEGTKNQRPWFVDAIADRDLWQWKVDRSVDTCMAMFSLGYYESIEKFNEIQYVPKDYLAIAGSILNEKNKNNVNAVVGRAVDCYAKSLIDPNVTWKVKVVECDHTLASEVGNRLASEGTCDFAIIYRYDIIKDEWWCSARASDKSPIDLTEVLKHFDPKSGGHPKAAGFSLSNGNSLRTILTPAPEKFK